MHHCGVVLRNRSTESSETRADTLVTTGTHTLGEYISKTFSRGEIDTCLDMLSTIALFLGNVRERRDVFFATDSKYFYLAIHRKTELY